MGRAIAVDWSGAASAGEQRRKIWVASAHDGSLVTLTSGRTRSATVDHLLDLLDAWPDAVVGLDFSFSFPAWWLESLGISHVRSAWDLAASQGSEWLAGCPPPFWGRPGRARQISPPLGYRRTELALTPRPGSVFQIGGAGSVGTASIRGMPHLRRLAEAGVAIWPFDPWPDSASGRGPVVAEVWPRLSIGSVVKSRAQARVDHLHQAGFAPALLAQAVASDDAFDAACAAVSLSASSLAAGYDELDAIDRLEGRILVSE